MAELPPLIHRKNTKVIGHINDFTSEQLQELFLKNKERLNGSIAGNKKATAQQERPQPSAMDAFKWGAVHGVSWSYDDEIAAAASAIPSFFTGEKGDTVKKYNEVAKRWRDYQKAADRDHPYLYLAGNVVGGAASLVPMVVSAPVAGAAALARAAVAGGRAVPAAMRAVPALLRGRSAVTGAKITGDAAMKAAANITRRAAEKAAASGAKITSKALEAGERAVHSVLTEGAMKTATKAVMPVAERAAGNKIAASGAKITSQALAAGERATQLALAKGATHRAAKAAGKAAVEAAAKKEAAKFYLRRAAKTGTIYGAISGSGEGEGFWNTLGTTATGALFGIATPVVASGISKVIPSSVKQIPSATIQGLGKLVGVTKPATHGISTKALRKVSHSLGDDVMDNLGKTLKQRGPDSMIIDLHEGLSARAFDAAKKDYDTYAIVKNRLGARQDEIARRVNDGITKVLGPKVNTNDLKQEIINKAQEKAGPLYERAKAMPIAKTAQEKLSLLQKRPAFRKSSDKAMERVLNDVDPKILASKSSPQLDMRLLHKAKEVLDDKINSAAIKGERGYSRELMNVKKELLDVLETSSPEYAKARNLYRSELEIGDALDHGKKALEKTVDLDMIKSQLAGMGSLERDAFRKGVREQIEHESKNANNPEHSLLSLFNTQNTQEKLQHIYSKDQAAQLMKMLRAEAEKSKLFSQLPKHIGEVGERAAQNDKNTKNLSPLKAVMKLFTGPWARIMQMVHKDAERDIAALITARERGDIGLSRKKAVELLQKFHEAEKQRLIRKDEYAKLINLVGRLLNGTAVRRIANE